MASVLTSPAKPPYPTDRLVTALEFSQHPEWGRCELRRGRVIPLSPPKRKHGILVARLAARLSTFVEARKLGAVVAESGMLTARGPDSVRGPDVSFISTARLAKSDETHGYSDVPPELCIEVVSPSDTWSELSEKVGEYLAAGVDVVWVVDPQLGQVHVYAKGQPPRILKGQDVLDGGTVLPGFTLALSDLFAALTR
jgi:Uma2 family endonuclease